VSSKVEHQLAQCDRHRHRHNHRHADRQTQPQAWGHGGRQTNRQTQKHRHRHRHRDRDRHTDTDTHTRARAPQTRLYCPALDRAPTKTVKMPFSDFLKKAYATEKADLNDEHYYLQLNTGGPDKCVRDTGGSFVECEMCACACVFLCVFRNSTLPYCA